MSIIIEATAWCIRPTMRSERARSLLRSTYCSRVTVENGRDTSKYAFSVAIGRPLAVVRQVNLNKFRLRGVSYFALGGAFARQFREIDYWALASVLAGAITSSARATSDGGIVTPRAFAVFKLITRSNSVGCSTGRSPALAPFKMRST